MINPAVHEARGVSEVDNQGEFGIGGRTRVARLGRVMAVRELTVSANDLATMEVSNDQNLWMALGEVT